MRLFFYMLNNDSHIKSNSNLGMDAWLTIF